jgi:phosphoglycolate phosphatase-like HAD superfamily hydrolase
MKIELVVFDLDGTLVSSHETIYRATIHALKEVNLNAEIPRDRFINMIGLHFEDIFSNLGFSVPDFDQFLSIYKSVYFNFIGFSSVYCGVEELLDSLIGRRIKTALLTTKSQDQSELILKHFSLFEKFDYVMGRRPGIPHKPSPEPLLKICRDTGTGTINTLIAGDSEMDILCGKSAGTQTCAVTYGYRSKGDLEKEKPDFLIDNIIEIAHIVDAA